MAQAGIFAPHERVELLDGEIIPMLPIGSWHHGAVIWLDSFFQEQSRGRWLVSCQGPLHAGPRDVPQPDLLLIQRRPDFYKRKHPRTSDAFLAIEVSDSSLRLDRTRKLPMYARTGVPEVWIVNVPERSIEVFRSRSAREYKLKFIVKAGDPLAPEAFPDVALNTADLLSD